MLIINNTKDLESFCEGLASSDFITVDLEFIREKTYYPLLCLIQIASKTESAVVDPLANNISLTSFFDLMKNPKITKVFHSCRQDIEIIHELSGIIPAPLFDTQIAAMVCGFGESISYEKLVNAVLGISLDKTDRLSNWQHRPLDESQLEYAIGDVTHLVKIYEHLLEEMKHRNRLHWIDEEMKILSQETTYYTSPDEAWHKIRHRSHSYKVLSNLKALAAWREKRAMDKNVPRQSVIKDDQLVIIATNAPKNQEALINIRGMKKDIASGKIGEEILQVLSKVKYDSKIIKELKQENYKSIPALVELFKMLLKLISHQEGVVARLIAGDEEIQKLASYKDKDNPALSGWRYEIFGKEALKIRNGEINIHYNPETKNIEFLKMD